MGRWWLSGRKRQTVNLLVILALVRIQFISKILNKQFFYKNQSYKIFKTLNTQLNLQSINSTTNLDKNKQFFLKKYFITQLNLFFKNNTKVRCLDKIFFRSQTIINNNKYVCMQQNFNQKINKNPLPKKKKKKKKKK